MKILLRDLYNFNNEKVYPVDIDYYQIENNIYIRGLKDVKGDISFYYLDDELRINYQIVGKMICPDAYDLSDVEVDFDLSLDEKVVDDTDAEGFYLNEDKTLEEMVLYIVLPDVPIKVVKKGKIEYPRGDGWSFVSEEDYESSRVDEIDPRLQKLKEYKIEEDD